LANVTLPSSNGRAIFLELKGTESRRLENVQINRWSPTYRAVEDEFVGGREQLYTLLCNPNYSTVLRKLWTWEPLTRNEIVEKSGLAVPTVSRIVGDFVDVGLIRGVGKVGSSAGRKPTLVGLAPDRFFLIGIDIGASQVRGALVDMKANPRSVAFAPVRPGDRESVIGAVVETVRHLIDESNVPLQRIAGVGLAVPGSVDLERKTLINASNLQIEGWEIVADVSDHLELPTYLENDASAAALGEHYFGAGHAHDHLAYVSIDVGIGMGLIIGERVFRGSLGLAGELGHNAVLPDGPQCTCGGYGCLESVAGGWALVKEYERAQGHSKNGSVRHAMTAHDVLARWRNGDAEAKSVVDTAVTYLGMSVANLVNSLGLKLVVIGGGLADTHHEFVQAIKARAMRSILPEVREHVSIKPSALAGRAVMIGAAALVLDDIFDGYKGVAAITAASGSS